jgi:DNA-directed RNA polymerase specialized sigma24 family protein
MHLEVRLQKGKRHPKGRSTRPAVSALMATGIATKKRRRPTAALVARSQRPESRLPASPEEDELLVVRCLRNDRDAWALLFESCQPRIIARLCNLLGRYESSVEVAHEIAAQVWLSILADDGRALRHFNAGAGTRLATYLNGIAVKQGLSYLRRSRRRLRHEAEYFTALNNRPEGSPFTELDLLDFTKRLTPREAAYFSEELISDERKESGLQLTDQNAWQLRHRIRRKLLQFMHGDV